MVLIFFKDSSRLIFLTPFTPISHPQLRIYLATLGVTAAVIKSLIGTNNFVIAIAIKTVDQTDTCWVFVCIWSWWLYCEWLVVEEVELGDEEEVEGVEEVGCVVFEIAVLVSDRGNVAGNSSSSFGITLTDLEEEEGEEDDDEDDPVMICLKDSNLAKIFCGSKPK